MYKPERDYHELRTRVSLNGYAMALTMSGHACLRARQRIHLDADDVLQRIALVLENPAVAEYVTLDVKVGDNCAIHDADTGSTYFLLVEETEITVKTVYAPSHSCDTVAARPVDACMLVRQNEVLYTGNSWGFRHAVEHMALAL